MSKIISVKRLEAVRALDGLQDDVKNYKASFIVNDEPGLTITKVIVEEFSVPVPFDQNSENQTIAGIMNGGNGTVIADSQNHIIPPEVDIANGTTLDYGFKYKAYAAGNAGEHHKVLKVIITLSDNDELWHLLISKRRNTNPGTEGDVMNPVKP